MSNFVRAGYMGLADLGGTKVRCTSFSVNASQDVLFYNHVIGLKDTIPTDSSTKGEILPKPVAGNTYANVQRKIWRPSPITIAGGISFPATETSLVDIFNLARYANYFDVNFTYFCADGSGSSYNSKIFQDCRINGFDINMIAGDIINVSMDVVGKNVLTPIQSVSYQTPEKIITWDKAVVTLTNAPFTVDQLMVQGLNFKINNNIQTVYTVGSSSSTTSLLPFDLRVGMQEVTGILTVYLGNGYEFIPIDIADPAIISVSLPNLSLKMTVVFKSDALEGLVGPVMTQLPFVGVDYSFA